MPKLIVVDRDYPHVGEQWRALGPLVEKLGTAVKGASWVADEEVAELRAKQRRRAGRRGRRTAVAGARRAWPARRS